jgi:AcrR family transcriptional regulator
MPAISLSRKEAAAQRRVAILEAARAVFARQGYAETVVDDIAAQAGVAKGTVYLYFPSKEQIYLAALMEDARNLHAESRSAMESADTWQEKLRAFVEVRLRYFEAHQDFFRIFLTEFRSMYLRGKPVSAELQHLVEEGQSQLARMVAAAAARGEIRAVDPDLTALTISDLTCGLMERRLRLWGRPMGAKDVPFALDLMCRSLSPEP